ncbi:hypothetical protein [Lysobacter antibioticus]|uniref:Uncharacterized protein n=1 Tax=Lysobacter antibioticus TaxID=84531 RepID=A0A0S2F7I6_LYSAN|nr:hypothetical protein [Lysobacter antibioticus]ALN79516.1 hypothetical protein LA76x_1359 [Lysobacter antibioticus]
MQSLPPGLVPPDVASLPALPPRFAWCLPSLKQHRRPTPEARYIVVLGHPMPVATASPGVGRWTTQLGVHRKLYSHRLYREFGSREAALRYVAAWAAKYADRIVAEIEGA